MSKENFFVGIGNPVNVRRLLLNSSKDVLDALKDYENFGFLKEEKARYIIELKKVVDEVLVLNKKMRSHLPKTPLQAPPVRTAPSRSHDKKAPEPKISRVASKMDELETELSKVESRLKALE